MKLKKTFLNYCRFLSENDLYILQDGKFVNTKDNVKGSVIDEPVYQIQHIFKKGDYLVSWEVRKAFDDDSLIIVPLSNENFNMLWNEWERSFE
jgi:hypothetical protein